MDDLLLPARRRRPDLVSLTAFSAVLLCVAALVVFTRNGERKWTRELISKRAPGYPRTPMGFWQQRIGGAQRQLSLGAHKYYGAYSAKNDPWLKAGKGTYGLWAADYAKRHPRVALASMDGGEDSDEKSQQGEADDFYKWVEGQGGEAGSAFKASGFQTTGAEYVLALKRLGISSFDDLLSFDVDKDLPGYDCDDGQEPEGDKSGHFLCGQLRGIVEDAVRQYRSGKGLWYVDGRTKLRSDDIEKKLARVRERTARYVRDEGGSAEDDSNLYCYSQYQEDPEYSECMHVLKTMLGRGHASSSWKDETKGLWGNLDKGGSADEDASMMGQSWSQLTAGLWDDKPYKERNGLEYR